MEKKYYVYTHSINDEVFYVGKGSDRRAYFLAQRSEKWKEIVGNSIKLVKVDIVKYFEYEDEAYKYEEDLISYLKSIGQCRANISIGKIHSPESKQKQSDNLKAENAPWFGKQLSQAHRQKLSISRTGERNHRYGKFGADHSCSKPIVAIFPNGTRIIAPSRTELVKILKMEFGIGLTTIKKCISTGEPFKAYYKRHEKLEGLKIKYVET